METKYAGMSYEQALRKFADTVTRICLVHCGNRTDAEDCFQNVFLKFYKVDMEFENEAHMKAWLIRVALNECTDWHRQVWKRRITLLEDTTALSEQLTQDQEDGVLPYLCELPFKYKRALYCYYYEDMKIKEIADQLGISENTVKTQLTRGRKLLEEKLNDKRSVHTFA